MKSRVVDFHFLWDDVPSEAKVEAKLAIEKKLLRLPILEYPDYEIQQISEAVRDHVYAPFRSKPVVQQVQPQKQEVVMPMTKVLSGWFFCPQCDEDYDLDRTPESEAKCPTCRVPLEEDDDQGEEAQDDA